MGVFQLQVASLKVLLVVFEGIGLDLSVGFALQVFPHCFYLGVWIGTDVVVVHKIGGGAKVEGDGLGVFNPEVGVIGAYCSAFGDNFELGFKADLPIDAEVVRGSAFEQESILAIGVHGEIVGAVIGMGGIAYAPQVGFKTDFLVAGRDAQDHHLIGCRNEGFAAISHIPNAVRNATDPRL